MLRHLAAYVAVLAAIMALDFLWLGYIAKPIYQAGIGHLMLDEPKVPVALAFYALYALALMLFCVLPHGQRGWLHNAGWAALFGLFAYATYDLSNLATLRGWPIGLAMMDIAWGATLSALAATAGKAAFDRIG